MIYIKGLKFRGFKSFRKAEASFPQGYVCLAGPNGSGKSNVTDGIRFALGEASLKALRAKRISELINTSCKFAEVTLFIDGERQYEVKRAINNEGKTLYRINGKRSTRTLVMDELRHYGLESGSHNIIAQGQVQKIIEMSSKERRQIIDSVAGISEFDARKDEALSELSKVEQKITEANIVLGERSALLTELEKEKDDALAYISAQDNYKRAMASIANAEYTKTNKSFTDIVSKNAEVSAAKEELSKQSAVLGQRIGDLSSQKQEIVSKLGSSESREAALAEIEQLKVKEGADFATLGERKKEAERLTVAQKVAQQRANELEKEKKGCASSAAALSSEESSLSKSIAEMEKKLGTAISQGDAQSGLDALSERIISLKEQKASLEASLRTTEKMRQMKQEEKERLSAAVGSIKEGKADGERQTLLKEISSLQSQLESLFEQERELNHKLPELEKRHLSCKEKAAALRATIAPSAMSMAVRAVEEMKQNGMRGIFGTVTSLIAFEPKYGTALEAAAGQRLSNVVVDRTDTAIKAIEKLKEQKAGRCTFIPLDIPKQQFAPLPDKSQGCLGEVIDFVDFDPAHKVAMEYVFSGTLLFDTVQNAKKAGVGRARMVTLEGELLEKSGVITGGAQKGSLLSKAALEKTESEAERIKKEREDLYSRLYSIREEMNQRRKEKADSEVKLKGIEIEEASMRERAEAGKNTLRAIADAEKEISSFQQEIANILNRQGEIAKSLEKEISEYESTKKKIAAEQEKLKQADAESHKRLQQLHSKHSSIEAQLEAKKAEIARLGEEQSGKEKEAKEAHLQISICKNGISELEAGIAKCAKLREEKERKLAEISSTSQKLFAKLKEFEGQIAEVSAHLGKIKLEEEKRSRELMEIEIRRRMAETKLADLKATLEQYAGVPTIDATKTELEELSNKSRATMDSLGMVNMRAPELYEEKKKDIEEIKSRVSSLDSEKAAVFQMMDEIEGKKRNIFLTTFSSINDNFKRLFGFVFRGEGTLLLEQPSNPFESGLLVKVRDESHDKYLDSMSGGEKSLLALIFIFAIQMHKAAPFYILDEADAALDKENSRKLANLIKQLSSKTQFIVVTHNDIMLSSSDVALGVTKTEDGSKIVGVQLTSASAVANQKKA